MPVYLCKPGCWASEPWRHGIQVYAFPFPIDSKDVYARTSPSEHVSSDHKNVNVSGELKDTHTTGNERDDNVSDTTLHSDENKVTVPQGVAIRRVRHAEVVLVDDVCIDYGRYWLRLRWPGKGGFAGYIALGVASPCMTRQATGTYTHSTHNNAADADTNVSLLGSLLPSLSLVAWNRNLRHGYHDLATCIRSPSRR